MELKTFKEICEGVILVDKLSEQSKLRQMVEGVIVSFGLCPKGTVVALDNSGEVICTKAEVIDNKHLCGDDLSSCDFNAVPTDKNALIKILNRFPLEDFLKVEETLLPKTAPSKRTKTKPGKLEKPVHLSEEAYDDEDEGVSPFLAKDAAAKKRAEVKKEVKKFQED